MQRAAKGFPCDYELYLYLQENVLWLNVGIDFGTSREHKLHLRRRKFLGLFGGMKKARSAEAARHWSVCQCSFSIGHSNIIRLLDT